MFQRIIWRSTNSSTLVIWTAKLGALVKIFTFYWENMVFLWGFCLLLQKMILLLSIPNKQLPIVARYLEVFCRIIEYPAKSTSSEFIYCRRTAEFLRERIPFVLISGKIIWGNSYRIRTKQVCSILEYIYSKQIEHLLL